ncbi:MAG: MipA/OmpV family protein [Burkholderiales bacterium]|nr:MipA/OmpV family protein [Burkholderiales bacterium]
MSLLAVRRCLPILGLFALLSPAGAAQWSGAVTLVGRHSPDYLGARESGYSVRPGLFVRYGRITASSGAGFAARREDAELRGLGVDLTKSDDHDLSLGLRVDRGRDESRNPALAGMGDVKATLRLRVGGSWRFAPEWQVRGNWTLDAFGRGGGNIVDLKLQHDWMLMPRVELTSSATLTIGGERYMQTWFGVTPEQSVRSGHPVYEPKLGVRDLTLALSVKTEVGEDWVFIGGPAYTRMLGPAARSPLVQRRSAWLLSAGVGYRF